MLHLPTGKGRPNYLEIVVKLMQMLFCRKYADIIVIDSDDDTLGERDIDEIRQGSADETADSSPPALEDNEAAYSHMFLVWQHLFNY